MTVTAIVELFDKYLKGEHRDRHSGTVTPEYMALATSLANLCDVRCQK